MGDLNAIYRATSATNLSGTAFEGGVRDAGAAALVSAGAFGGIHGRVGDVDEIVDEVTLGGGEARAQRDADDADTGRNGVAGGGDGLAQLFGDVVQVVGAVNVGDDEFFTAEASDHRCRRADQAKSTGHRDQGLVSGGMTMSVVEALEVIQIHHRPPEGT